MKHDFSITNALTPKNWKVVKEIAENFAKHKKITFGI
jgi:hypothetical protein